MIMTDTQKTLWDLRNAKGMTQQDLSVASGVSAATISSAERGIPISRKTFFLLCLALECAPTDVQGVNLINPVKPKRKES